MEKNQSRKEQILRLLSKMGQVQVTSLAELCQVSQVTIRTDLENLEKAGTLAEGSWGSCPGKVVMI